MPGLSSRSRRSLILALTAASLVSVTIAIQPIRDLYVMTESTLPGQERIAERVRGACENSTREGSPTASAICSAADHEQSRLLGVADEIQNTRRIAVSYSVLAALAAITAVWFLLQGRASREK